MEVRQIVYDGVGGLKLHEGNDLQNNVASLKYDGSQYHLHIANGRAYALTSKRVSKKTGMYSDRIENFPQLKDIKFPFKKETIIVCEVCAEHLLTEFESERLLNGKGEPYSWSKRASFVASIMNANPETIESRYPKGNPLALVSFSILLYEGVDVSQQSFIDKYMKYLKPNFELAGKFGDKIKKYSGRLYTLSLMSVEEILDVDNDMFNEGIITDKGFAYEGFVINRKKSNQALKIKRMKNADAIVIGYDWNSTGKYRDNEWIKSIIVGCFVDNQVKIKNKNKLTAKEVSDFQNIKKLIPVGKISGFDEALRADVSTFSSDYIGKVVECEFMEWTGKAMRHPRISEKGFRDDKLVTRCTLDQMD